MLFRKILNIGVVAFIVTVMLGCSSKDKDINGKYSELPVVKDLTYYLKDGNGPERIFGELVYRVMHSPLSAYEKGRALGSGATENDIRWEKLTRSITIIDSRLFFGRLLNASIDSSKYNEFEKDEFFKKMNTILQDVIHRAEKNNNFKRHIRLVNLEVPILYSKLRDGEAYIDIKSKDLEKFRVDFSMKKIDFISNVIKDDFFTKNIIDDGKNIQISSKIDCDEIIIKGDNEIINNIGKNNKGKDTIVELTLFAEHPRDGIEMNYGITSFKLKSQPDKRFVNSSYIDKLGNGDNSPSDTFYIEKNDVEFYTSDDD